MPRQTKPLTDTECKQAKPGEKDRKLFDGGGLYLLVKANGSRLWRLKYVRPNGKEGLMSLGAYPEISLAGARAKRDQARSMLAQGHDPQEDRARAKEAAAVAASNSFESVARVWFEKFMGGKSESHRERTLNRLETDIFPWLGKRPVSDIRPQEILACLHRIEARGAIETAHRVRWSCSKVFRFAIACGIAETDPADLLKEALTRPDPKSFATITDPVKVGTLMNALDSLEASLIVRCAARLAPLVFVRPGELRQAEWSEIDLEKAEWRIPAHKMKSRAVHIVPLSRQAIAILEEIRPLTGNSDGRYVFPGERTRERPMSENTVNAALRRLGYSKEEFTGHGFRKTASTLLNESQCWHRDAIERQLAHGERDEIRAAYNYAEHLPERIQMMQWWADYLDKLKSGADVFSISPRAA
ncbi:tyrosine-type recombinase/integrase [Silvimonas iriomotensis]|uniref:Integrase n=1 Tax=Silvimonas iriomotensis TaxID=449662 RepID=A0ABQ2P4W5_9NEIS|nr:integrase arm-type DNA-binding domain-containing protein [Silvimonas iriomotensis]GGP18156.1 integrase [Silvimonas iriomotensis]